jgi:hypothetical protein
MIYLSTNFFCIGGASVVVVNDNQEYLLSNYLEIFEDVSARYTIDDVSDSAFAQNFLLNTADYRFAENGTSAYWIRVYIKNLSPRQKKWVFEVLSLQTQDFKLFVPDENNMLRLFQTGENFDFDRREYLVQNFVFNLPDKRNEVYPIYIRVQTNNEASFEYKIRSQEYYIHYATEEYYFLGIFYGILFFLAVYNILLFFTSREKTYLFYILYILICILISFTGDGLGFEYIWPHHPWVNKLVSRFSLWFSFLIAFVLYAKYFIEFGNGFSKFNIFLAGSIAGYVFLEISQLVPETVIIFFYLLPFLLIYAFAIHAFLKGTMANRYFILGQTFLLASMIITRLSWYGFIDSNIFTVYSFNFGVVAEGVVFSYAFVDKYNHYKKEKEKAQILIINQLEENQILQTKVNHELEEKVKERTVLLEKEKEKLNEANAKLEVLMAEVNQVNSRLDYDNWQLNKKVTEETKARILAEEVSYTAFQKIFPNEFSCLKYLEELKWPNEYKCRKCGNSKFTPLRKLLSRRCSKCSFIESVTNTTLFHALKFPINKAFYIVYHCSFASDKMTIDELSEVLELRRNTVWQFKKRVVERLDKLPKATRNKKKWESIFLD